MVIYIGADHRGFQLKSQLTEFIQQAGYTVIDAGNEQYDESDDYTDFASVVAEKVSLDPDGSRGIIICGSGIGVSVIANKFRNVRAALVTSPDQAFDSRNDDATNILALAASYTPFEMAKRIAITWFETPISAEPRHARRLEKIAAHELKVFRDREIGQ